MNQLRLDACLARFDFAPEWPAAAPGIDWTPLVCTLPREHDGPHVDEREAIPWSAEASK
jgi:hypothetical protein